MNLFLAQYGLVLSESDKDAYKEAIKIEEPKKFDNLDACERVSYPLFVCSETSFLVGTLIPKSDTRQLSFSEDIAKGKYRKTAVTTEFCNHYGTYQSHVLRVCPYIIVKKCDTTSWAHQKSSEN